MVTTNLNLLYFDGELVFRFAAGSTVSCLD